MLLGMGHILDISPLAVLEFEVGPWAYLTEVETDDDDGSRWITHWARASDGRVRRIDYTPRWFLDRGTFAMLARLGFPRRDGIGPLHKSDVHRLMAAAGGEVAA